MHNRLPLLLRAIAYGLRGGFLIRPLLIALSLGAVGGVLSSLEEQVPTLGASCRRRYSRRVRTHRLRR